MNYGFGIFHLLPVGIFSSQKTPNFGNYYQSLTAIETGPKNLEYFTLCLYTLKIRIHYVVINFKQNELRFKIPQKYKMVQSKQNTPT